MLVSRVLLAWAALVLPGRSAESASPLPAEVRDWKLFWQDGFNDGEAGLDAKWKSQNGPSGHILCSRWRENARVANGMLRLENRKEKRGGQEWTSGSLTTHQSFQYGYFECRYRYAAATGTNNSFWLMTLNPKPDSGKKFEIDINEGHFPNEVNTNIHNWSDVTVVNGKKRHPSSSKSFNFGVRPDCTIQLEIPVRTRKIRLTTQSAGHCHIGEFRVYRPNQAGFPEPFSKSADRDRPGLVNLMRAPGTQIRVSGSLDASAGKRKGSAAPALADGNPQTRWVSEKDGPKWLEVEFSQIETIGCVQFLNGWKSSHGWEQLLDDYRVEYHDGSRWLTMAEFDIRQGQFDFAKDFHTYGLKWTREELVFYFDGRELRRERNDFCHSPSPVWLSLAIIPWAGKITNAVHGTFMEVDYVRVYQPPAATEKP